MLEAHQTHQSVIGRAATGLGKAVELAALAAHYSQFGRVLILVDTRKLVQQLATTAEWFTGTRPGIEMGDERAINGEGGWLLGMQPEESHDRIVVSTVQTQFSGPEGKERYRKFNPKEFAAVLLDECELFLAPKSMSVVKWYLSNPDLRVYGCTATPFRTDGVSMAHLFQTVAFNRDIHWGIDNGWLVPGRQAFVKVNLDFSTLKVRKGDDGELDYSEDEIAAKISNEQTLIELATGIIKVAGDRKSIVVCPGKHEAKIIAQYLCARKDGCARSIYGDLGDTERDDIFEAFDRSDFQFLTSCMMLTKGFDQPDVSAVFLCRKTKSKRLYQQVLGRGTRTLKGIVDGLATADERRAAIAASAKPDMLMVNMVGIDGSVRDVTLIDILGEVSDEAVVERAKRIVEKDGKSEKEAVEQAQMEIEFERQDARDEADRAAEMVEEDEREQFVRHGIQVEGDVSVEFHDDLYGGGAPTDTVADPRTRQANVLKRFKYPDEIIARLSPEKLKDTSRKAVARASKGMVVSWPQIQFLRRLGASDEQIRGMSKVDADVFIKSRTGERRGAA